MGILVEATCLVVSGDIDKLIAEEKESKKVKVREYKSSKKK